MVVYIWQCYFLNLSDPLLPALCPQVCSGLHLHSCFGLSPDFQGPQFTSASISLSSPCRNCWSWCLCSLFKFIPFYTAVFGPLILSPVRAPHREVMKEAPTIIYWRHDGDLNQSKTVGEQRSGQLQELVRAIVDESYLIID